MLSRVTRCTRLLKVTMAYLGNITPPTSIGFVRNPNLILPLYILTEVHTIQLGVGQVANLRRPRPLSVISGAEVVLQSDPFLLRRYVVLCKEKIKKVFNDL